MLLNEVRCPACDTPDLKVHSEYTVQSGGPRRLYYGSRGHCYFSETDGTPRAGLRTPRSRMQQILDARNDGMRVKAAGRTFQVSKHTRATWHERLSPVKAALRW